MPFFNVPETEVYKTVRAKYIPTENGFRLAKIQSFSVPKFRADGFELSDNDKRKASVIVPDDSIDELAELDIIADPDPDPNDILRAIKRAQINAFDVILSNPDLDTFVTLTYSPEEISDKADYDACYDKLKNWLSNRVQRRNLIYVGVPERTKKGDIHFHFIMNSDALKLVPAISPKSGRPLTHNGKSLYNLPDWSFGFTSAEKIGSADGERDAVAKYIFKYMRKQFGQKIGGRYCLIGGDVKKPMYILGNNPEEFFDGSECKYDNEINLDCGISYREWSYI